MNRDSNRTPQKNDILETESGVFAQSQLPVKVLLTGGGTGGHLFPAIAVAEEFRRKYPKVQLLFIGTKRKLDSDSLARYGFRCKTIESAGIKGKNPLKIVTTCLRLAFGLLQALKIIRDFRPDIVFGVGGYVTAPVLLAAKVCGVASVIHEQNSVAGLANRKLSSVVDKICLSLPNSEDSFSLSSRKKLVYTGNPIRETIIDSAKKRERQVGKTILILGGSLGAHRLNVVVPQAMGLIGKQVTTEIQIIHQTGKNDVQQVREEYAGRGIRAEVFSFIDDIEASYSKAALVISRGGATTLTELAVLGKPAIIVPYPYAADNHQQKNGAYYEQQGGVEQCLESELTAKNLAQTITKLLFDTQKLTAMGQTMRTLAVPDAAERIVNVCIELLDKKMFRETCKRGRSL